MTTNEIKVGDRFRDPGFLSSPCLVTEVDPEGRWFKAFWTPGSAPTRYPSSMANRWKRVQVERD